MQPNGTRSFSPMRICQRNNRNRSWCTLLIFNASGLCDVHHHHLPTNCSGCGSFDASTFLFTQHMRTLMKTKKSALPSDVDALLADRLLAEDDGKIFILSSCFTSLLSSLSFPCGSFGEMSFLHPVWMASYFLQRRKS